MIVAETKHATVGKGRIVLAQASWKKSCKYLREHTNISLSLSYLLLDKGMWKK